MSKTKSKVFDENVLLSDDEIIEKEFYQPTQEKSRQAGNQGTKPRSFDEEVEKIAVELPKRLVKKMRIIAAERESRFNIEAAAAFEMYLKKLKAI